MPDDETTFQDAFVPPNKNLFPVWDHTGKLHHVDHLNFHDLIVNCRWHRTDPNATKEAPPTPVGQQGVAELFPVWDPRGNMHMVDALNKVDMVTKLGWFDHAPIQVGDAGSAIPVPTEAVKPPPPAPVIQMDGNVNPDAGKPIEGEPSNIDGDAVDLNALSTDGLRRFALDRLQMNFGPEVSHADMLSSVVAELEVE